MRRSTGHGSEEDPTPSIEALLDRARGEERQGALDEALRWYRTASDALPEGLDPELAADVVRWTGTVLREMGETADAELHYRRSLAMAEDAGYTGGQAHAVNCLAIVAHRRGDMVRAAALYRRAGRLAAQARSHRLLGMIEQNLGVMANMRGDLDGALVQYRAALRSFEDAADQEGVSWVLNNLGMLETDLARFAEAEEAFLRGLEIARSRGDLLMEGLFHLNRTEMLIAMGSLGEAEEACRLALSIAEERGDPVRRAEALKHSGAIARARGAGGEALGLLTEARGLAAGAEDTLLEAEILREIGDTRWSAGELHGAREAWTASLDGFSRRGAVLDASGVQDRLAGAPPWDQAPEPSPGGPTASRRPLPPSLPDEVPGAGEAAGSP